MYLGRILAVGKAEQPFIAYRVSSRSFPDRVASLSDHEVAIIPKNTEEDNPYIYYNCLIKADTALVGGNGTHTDPIAQRLREGDPPLEAISKTLKLAGYEKDDYDTPRIAAVIKDNTGYLGTIRKDGLETDSFTLQKNQARVLATYELNKITDQTYSFEADSPQHAARIIFDHGPFADFENPVCSAAYLGGFAIYNPIDPNDALTILKKLDTPVHVLAHCKAVEKKATQIAENLLETHPTLDLNLVRTGALLHDIGRTRSHDITHNIQGVEIAKNLNLSTEILSIIYRHIGAGLDPDEAEELGLPRDDYNPQTLEEKIVTYADLLASGDKILSFKECYASLEKKFAKKHLIFEKFEKLHQELEP